TGYFRTLYQPAQVQALQGAFPRLPTVDPLGVLRGHRALLIAGFQPMGGGLGFAGQVPTAGHQQLVEAALGTWDDLYDDFDEDTATQAAIAARQSRLYGPRLQQLGFMPRQGEPAMDAVLRTTLIGTLGKEGDPAVVAEAKRLFAAW